MSTPTQLPKIYVTEHPHSQVICQAFAKGCGGQLVPPLRLMPGIAVVYGVLRGCGEIIRKCEWIGRDYLHIDLGFFRRGHYDGYYRVTWNGRQPEEVDYTLPDDRWREVGLPLAPWRKTGRNVVVIPIPHAAARHISIDADQWLETVTAEIQQHTDRPVIVKPKEEGDLKALLADAWCLVTHSSNAAVVALLNGVPVVTLGESAAYALSTPLEKIDAPFYPVHRAEWLNWLAYNQFTLSEFQDGTAWRLLQDRYAS